MDVSYFYMVSKMDTEVRIAHPACEKGVKMELCWIDGMIGALPVFKTLESAMSYAGGDASIVYKIKLS